MIDKACENAEITSLSYRNSGLPDSPLQTVMEVRPFYVNNSFVNHTAPSVTNQMRRDACMGVVVGVASSAVLLSLATKEQTVGVRNELSFTYVLHTHIHYTLALLSDWMCFA